MKRIPYKFVSWDIEPYDSHAGTAMYELRKKLDNGGELTREEKSSLYNCMGREGTRVKYMGWVIPFDDVLKAFYLEQYGQVSIVYAPDKTTIRYNTHVKIDKITPRI